MATGIAIEENQKIFIANGIYRAITHDLPEIIEENGLPTSVGSGLFRWNFINKNLSEYIGGDFEVSFQKRGAWKFLLLRDCVTNLSFSIMSESNFKKIQKSPPINAHYLEVLISSNKYREPLAEQLSFYNMYRQHDSSALFDLRNQLLSNFSGIVSEHILIVFDYNFTGVTSAKAILLNPNMQVALVEDWTQYLKTTYIPKLSYLNYTLNEDEEILAKLKPSYDSPDLVTYEPSARLKSIQTT